LERDRFQEDKMNIRDKVIVVKVPTGPALEPQNGTMTRKEVQQKLEAEFARVNNEYYKEKSEYYEGYREGLSQALWLLKKME
jgi:Skp family chaperone for outer membrane proteins